MDGKLVVINGPTSGIGKEIAMGLGALGAELLLACRALRSGEATKDEIMRCTPVFVTLGQKDQP